MIVAIILGIIGAWLLGLILAVIIVALIDKFK